MRSIEQMVQQEVSCCLSLLVSTLANGDAQAGTDLAELCDRALGLAMPVPDYEEAAIQAGWYLSPKFKTWVKRSEDSFPREDREEYGSAKDMCENYDLEPIDSQVYEHWAVSPWLAEKLIARGEKVDTDFAALNVWARQTRDIPISADDVIVRIYAKMMA